MQKFNGHYKQIIQLNKSIYSKNNTMVDEYTILSQDKG